MSSEITACVRRWLAEQPPRDVHEAIERLARTEDVTHVVVLPDVHLATDVVNGAAIATSRRIYPQAVGGDIGCGMAAIRFDADAGLIDDERAAAALLEELQRRVPGNRHRSGTIPDLPEQLAASPLSDARLDAAARRDGRVQLGTLGRGNHFVELQADEEDRLWLLVHSGSRAMGQAITAHHLDRASTANTGLRFFEADSPEGAAYLADQEWARRYARANRSAMVEAAASLMQRLLGVASDRETFVDADHNHVQREEHLGEMLWVHRKGAATAREDEPGFLPGSMGGPTFHVVGRGCEESLCSAAHGAGRRLSRTEAANAVGVRELDRQMRRVWYDRRKSERLRDEAPAAYKDVRAVLKAERDLVRVVRELRPLINHKAV